MHFKEHQEAIDKFRERFSEKTTQISNIQKDLSKSKAELEKKVYVVLFFLGMSKIICRIKGYRYRSVDIDMYI